ncbi:YolD-like family protein [Alteribacter populi]|uniref:YolD-like family protein n=1 Tax=Alteribacter populi TaxID=2011011 RepID=UPI000BBA426F|nr:YolD-like family protein [Alteribacter populi]
MLRDRGVIKWTSMMLPEHVRELKQLKQGYAKMKKPEFDPQMIEEWGRILKESAYKQTPVSVSFIEEGVIQSATGFFVRFDSLEHLITLRTDSGERIHLSFDTITDLTPE